MKRFQAFQLLLGTLVLLTPLRAGTLVQFRSVFGDVEVELLDAEKPATVQNFLHYVKDGAYGNSFFHRSVPNFVLQGGGYGVTNRGQGNAAFATITRRAPVTNEFNTGPFVSNGPGTIAMAKTSDPNSATSEFFFNLVDNATALDSPGNSGGFTVFGRVVGGTNGLRLFNSFLGLGQRSSLQQPLTNVVANLGSPLTETPLLLVPTNSVGQLYFDFTNLVFVDITTVNLQVSPVATGTRQISWNSVLNGTNVVEFTTVFPPVWQVLTNVARPTAMRTAVLDPSGNRNRFYRVRTTY